MPGIIFVSGACGSGKTTFADAYAKHLVRETGRTCYVIHGDDFHRGFREPEEKGGFFVGGQASDRVLWEDILRFNWDCILATADRALRQNLDVVVDYVIEDELPRVRELAEKHHAPLYYIVLTAGAEELVRRIRNRGDTDLTERALFLKNKLETMPENQGHLYDNTGRTPEDMIREIVPENIWLRKTGEEAEGGRAVAMHSNWNPWHGCVRCSEGCQNCYVYYLDRMRGKSGADVYKTKTGFRYPLAKDKNGKYKIQSGEMISVCMTSDFFLEEADEWRPEAWEMMRVRSDVVFLLLTKRPGRIRDCLPADWGAGWDNVFLNVTCENQSRADERIPLLLELPFRHKGLQCAPLLGPVSVGRYLDSGEIEQVACGGENYGGSRPCDFEWVKALREECASRNITFCFMETGTNFIKDGHTYRIASKQLQNAQAAHSGMTFQGKPIRFDLRDSSGRLIPEGERYAPRFAKKCGECSFRILCNGCFNCGACEGWS